MIEHVQREETLSPSFKRVVTEEIIEKIVSPDNCLCALKTFYPEYEKNASHINAFGRHTAFACKRAKAMTGPHAGLGSSLPDLITHLCQLAAKPLDTAFDALPRIINDRDSARMAEFHKALSRLAVAATEILKAKLKRPENSVWYQASHNLTRLIDNFMSTSKSAASESRNDPVILRSFYCLIPVQEGT